MNRSGRPRTPGQNETGRHRSRVDRLAQRAALAPLAADGPAPLGDHVARRRAAAEALAAGPSGGPAHGSGARRRPAGAGAFDALAAEAEAARRSTPGFARSSIAAWPARRARGGGGHAPGHRDLGNARSPGAVRRPRHPRRTHRGDLAAAARRRPLARGAIRRASGCRPRAPHRPLRPRLPAGRRRRTVVLRRATRDAEAPTVASRWLLRLENLLPASARTARPRSPPPRRAAPAWSPPPARLDLPAGPVPPARRPAPRPAGGGAPARASRSPRSSGWSATPTRIYA